MSKRSLADLQAFVIECIEDAGGIVEVPEYGLAEAALPDSVAGIFGGKTFLRIAFDPEVAREHPDAELAVYGSEFLDRVVGLAAESGLTALRHIHVDRLEVTRVAERLTEHFQFISCRPALDHSAVREFGYLLFHFKLVFLTDEREEIFRSVLINQNENRPVHSAERLLQMATYTPHRQVVCPQQPVCSVQAAHRTACAFLKKKAESAFQARQAERRRRLDADLRRIHTYYDDLKEETEQRLERVSDPARAETLQHRLQAYEVERARRQKELEDKHALRLNARLTSAELLVQPKIVNTVRISHRDRSAPMEFVWDPLLKIFEPPLCARCGEELRTIAFDKNGQISCWGKGPQQDPD